MSSRKTLSTAFMLPGAMGASMTAQSTVTLFFRIRAMALGQVCGVLVSFRVFSAARMMSYNYTRCPIDVCGFEYAISVDRGITWTWAGGHSFRIVSTTLKKYILLLAFASFR
ncbi:hypothetical protein DFH06DRAFT_278661 [Mycena polygramma]|nr:hypothetical protein DFH06DRAFT_278661 [Mycena polygramma]